MFKKVGRKLLSFPLNLENKIYKSSADLEFATELNRFLKKVPVSNGSRYYSKINKRLGIICDSFLYEGFKNCCDLVYLTPQNYESELPNIDVLLITSTWHGLNNEWERSYRINSPSFESLLGIKSLAAKLDIPIAFYSKEDPPNFEVFKNVASESNVIFTSAIECVERYNELYPDIPCYHLPFAVNPLLHNPIGMFDHHFCNKALFAGTWMTKYPVRTQEQKNIFDWLLQSNWELTIVDRNYNRHNRNYYYPQKYRKYIVPNHNYTDIAKMYKLFPLIINVNSVSDSETMFAGRAYDASASGGMIISNNSIGMKRLFPYIRIIDSYEDLEHVLNLSRFEIDAIRLKGVRETYRLPTVYDVVRTIIEKAQNGSMKASKRSVLVVANKITDSIERDFNNQSYLSKQLVCEKKDTIDMDNFDMIAFWNSDIEYNKYYLEDLINSFKYTNCKYVTKCEAFNGHKYTDAILQKAKTVFWSKAFSAKELLSIPEYDFNLHDGYLSI